MTRSADSQHKRFADQTAKGRLPGVNVEAKPAICAPDLDEDQTVAARTYWSDKDFAAFTSLGAIVPGHSLICPAFSRFSNSGSRSLHDALRFLPLPDALTATISRVKCLLNVGYGNNPVFFEHGNHRSTLYPSICGTSYPHLHAVPGLSGLAEAVESASMWRYESVVKYDDLQHFYSSRRGLGEYLVVSDDEMTIAVWSGEDRRFPSQTLRHLAQHMLRSPINNWNDDPRPADAVAECRKLLLVVERGNVAPAHRLSSEMTAL